MQVGKSDNPVSCFCHKNGETVNDIDCIAIFTDRKKQSLSTESRKPRLKEVEKFVWSHLGCKWKTLKTKSKPLNPDRED